MSQFLYFSPTKAAFVKNSKVYLQIQQQMLILTMSISQPLVINVKASFCALNYTENSNARQAWSGITSFICKIKFGLNIANHF